MEVRKQEKEQKRIRIAAKIVAVASMISFIMSCSLLVSVLQQSLHLLSMYRSLSFMDKKYMFLLFNGIIGFVLKSFRGNSDTLSQEIAINGEIRNRQRDMRLAHVKKSAQVKSFDAEEQEEVIALSEVKEEEEEEVSLLVQDGEGEAQELAIDEGEAQELAIVRVDDDCDQDHEEYEDGNNGGDVYDDGLLSSEDLNKKCDDFIRKMKEEMRFESRKRFQLH